MKSLMQEGSSIIKAIEKAWIAAGQPKEFSVKVFEEAQKNFLGLTSKAAKIGLFFDEVVPSKTHVVQRKEKLPAPKKQEEVRHKKFEKVEQPIVKEPSQVREQQGQPGTIWNQEMISKVQDWLSNVLKTMDLAEIPFKISTQHYQLRITFEKPIYEDIERERQLFRNFSFLILQTLKRSFKRPLRGFKVVLTREQ